MQPSRRRPLCLKGADSERSRPFPTVDDSAFFTQCRLSVWTVVPDGPFFGTLRTAFPTTFSIFHLRKEGCPSGCFLRRFILSGKKAKQKGGSNASAFTGSEFYQKVFSSLISIRSPAATGCSQRPTWPYSPFTYTDHQTVQFTESCSRSPMRWIIVVSTCS